MLVQVSVQPLVFELARVVARCVATEYLAMVCVFYELGF